MGIGLASILFYPIDVAAMLFAVGMLLFFISNYSARRAKIAIPENPTSAEFPVRSAKLPVREDQSRKF